MSKLHDISAPPPIDWLYKQLGSETIRIRQQWIYYETLYLQGEKRRELLAERTLEFFRRLQRTYWDDIVLSIVRLTEDPVVAGHDTVVLKRLESAVEDDGRADLAEELSERLDKINDLRSSLEDARNRLIAHRDKEALVNGEDLSLPSLNEIETALTGVEGFLNAVCRAYDNSSVGYDALIDSSGAEALIAGLKQAVDYEDALQEGVIPPERPLKSPYSDA